MEAELESSSSSSEIVAKIVCTYNEQNKSSFVYSVSQQSLIGNK
jgi:hypothetical protein